MPLNPNQIEEIVEHIWKLMHELRLHEARIVLQKLLHEIELQPQSDNPSLLLVLAHVYHVAGYVTSMGSRTQETQHALAYYHQMENFSRLLNDQTLLNTALTYQGDMYRRVSDLKQAIEYLEGARDLTPLADPAARGNGLQLLGRAYFSAREHTDFEK